MSKENVRTQRKVVLAVLVWAAPGEAEEVEETEEAEAEAEAEASEERESSLDGIVTEGAKVVLAVGDLVSAQGMQGPEVFLRQGMQGPDVFLRQGMQGLEVFLRQRK